MLAADGERDHPRLGVTSVAVAGALAAKVGNGGEAWVRLSYALGFRRLGHDVCLIEEAQDASREALDYAESVADRFGLHYVPAEVAEPGDLLVNISGNVRSGTVRRRFHRTAFVDIDPGFTQFWHERRIGAIPPHDVYFTIAANIGASGCPIPTCGIDWRPTRPPVVLDEWPVADGGFDRFTTVSTWRSPFGPIEPYGLKHHQWRAFLDLPAKTGLSFEAALAIDPADSADRDALENHGWRLVDPAVAAEPEGFREYVSGSGAEFSVAQGIYVETRSGWLSDRTTRYLASGRPALVQDTGFTRTLPAGEGVVAFRTPDEAAAGARSITEDYERHARAARAVAEEHFDSDRVLEAMLAQVLH
jgi:hypothetical protein